MQLNYANIAFDADGRVEVPELMLQTLHGDTIGVIHGAAAINMNIKFSEPSELKFDLPEMIDGVANPDYQRVTGHKRIYTKSYGIYETLNPATENDGMSIVKHVTAYSLEKALANKQFFLEEGTFNFWDPVKPQDTILGRIAEKATGWTIGYVSPTLYHVYRTFDQVDEDLLQFVYGTITEKFKCCAVFDPYAMTINFYDSSIDLGTLPVYLDHSNLIEKLTTEEKSEELITALRPSGADDLSIREVNPTGSPWIYDLTNFIDNGDLPDELVNKWRAWEAKIDEQREYYIALISLRAATTARSLAEQAKLTDLQSELSELEARRNAAVQALALAATAQEKAARQADLSALTNIDAEHPVNNGLIPKKEAEIELQKDLCADVQELLATYQEEIQAVVDDLSFTNTENFTESEQEALQHYLIEGNLQEETFVATSIDASVSGQSLAITSMSAFSVVGTEVVRLEIADLEKTVYSLTGGTLILSGEHALRGKIVSATLETDAENKFLFSAHCGEATLNGAETKNLTVVVSGTYVRESDNIEEAPAASGDLGLQIQNARARINAACDGWNALTNGNVDYYRRPVVTAEQMIAAGWEEFDGEYATTYSSLYTEEAFSVSLTPIKDDGTILSPSALDAYEAGLAFTGTSEALLASDTDRLLIDWREGSYDAAWWEAHEEALQDNKDEHLDAWLALQELTDTTGVRMHDVGTQLTFATESASMFATAATDEYQQYSVQRELYDYAVKKLAQLATYTYEFSVDAGNFLFSTEFAPFRNALELGKGIYINLDGTKVVTPLIEIAFEFDDEAKLSLIFSNRIKRHDPVNTLKEIVETNKATSRSFDAGKYKQSLVSEQATDVSAFMHAALDVAKNRIIGAGNQSVVIDPSGIHVGEANTPYQLAIVNNMIAMTDDNWEHAKLALGLFHTPDNGTYFGINCDVLAGTLIVGASMVIEAPGANGVMQFKVDGSGAWINNGRMVLTNQAGGQMLIDPTHGIVAGKHDNVLGDLFTVDGTTVTTSYVYTDGAHAGEYKPNVSFVLDMATGNAYFAGELEAKSGEIGGFTIEETYLHGGTAGGYVALNGSATNTNALYAIWAGNASPESAPFWVKKDGTMRAEGATFADGSISGSEIVGGAIYVPNKTNPKFQVDSSGNVTLAGNITWSSSNSPVRVQYSMDGTGSWHDTFANTDYFARYSYDGGTTWTGAIEVRGQPGAPGAPGPAGPQGPAGSDADVTRANIMAALLQQVGVDGIYHDTVDGRDCIGINATAIRAGRLDASQIVVENLSASSINTGTLEGITIRSRDTFQGTAYGITVEDGNMYFDWGSQGHYGQLGLGDAMGKLYFDTYHGVSLEICSDDNICLSKKIVLGKNASTSSASNTTYLFGQQHPDDVFTGNNVPVVGQLYFRI